MFFVVSLGVLVLDYVSPSGAAPRRTTEASTDAVVDLMVKLLREARVAYEDRVSALRKVSSWSLGSARTHIYLYIHYI